MIVFYVMGIVNAAALALFFQTVSFLIMAYIGLIKSTEASSSARNIDTASGLIKQATTLMLVFVGTLWYMLNQLVG